MGMHEKNIILKVAVGFEHHEKNIILKAAVKFKHRSVKVFVSHQRTYDCRQIICKLSLPARLYKISHMELLKLDLYAWATDKINVLKALHNKW